MTARRGRRGANAIEFGLLAPVLVALLTGMMDISWMFLIREAADSMAQSGARAGALSGSAAAALIAADERWDSIGLPGHPVATAAQSGTPPMMVVEVNIDARALIGFAVSDTHIQVTAAKRMVPTP